MNIRYSSTTSVGSCSGAGGMERTQSTAEFLAEDGYNLGDLPETLASELQLLLAMYSDGRMRVLKKPSSSPHKEEERVSSSLFLHVVVTLFSQNDGFSVEVHFRHTTDAPVVNVKVLGRELLTEDSGIGRAAATFIVEAEQLGVQTVADCLSAGCDDHPAVMLQVLSVLQTALDELNPNDFQTPSRETTTENTQEEEASLHKSNLSLPPAGISVQEKHNGDGMDVHHRPSSSAALDLPYDCWWVIALYLGPIEVARAGATSSWLYEIVNDNSVWEGLYFALHPVVKQLVFDKGAFFENCIQEDFQFHCKVDWALQVANDPTGDMSSMLMQDLWSPHPVTAIAPKFKFSWSCSYRYAALSAKRLAILNLQKNGEYRRRLRTTTHRGKLSDVLDEAFPPYKALQDEVTKIDELLDGIEAASWCELFHASEKPGIKRLAQFYANYTVRNYNIALNILETTPFDKIKSKTRNLMHFPLEQTKVDELIHKIRLLSFDSDVEKEYDVTSAVVVRVKHRDYHTLESCGGAHQDHELNSHVARHFRNKRWHPSLRRYCEVDEQGEFVFNPSGAGLPPRPDPSVYGETAAHYASSATTSAKVIDAFGILRKERNRGNMISRREAERIARDAAAALALVKKRKSEEKEYS